MIDPSWACLFIPRGLRPFKNELFERIGRHLVSKGGQVIRYDVEPLAALPREIVPIVGCMPECTGLLAEWRKTRRDYIYWDRGYARRVFATWLPRGEQGGYYRWHFNCYQMSAVRDVPGDRWDALRIEVQPWRLKGKHIVIAAPTRTYAKFHHCQSWIADTIDALARLTTRQLVIRDKETKRPLQADLDGAHALVTHASITAVEAVILGTPVFVHPESAAALVGRTDLKTIEHPVLPDREKWLHSLAYCQFNERELIDGTLWSLMAYGQHPHGHRPGQ
jgi:hypothetical protein